MSKYDELKSYLPGYYDGNTEMEAHLAATGKQLDDLFLAQQLMRDNNFIWLADDATITRIEKFFGITYDGSRELDDRKRMIVALYTGNGHFGQSDIKDVVKVFTKSPCIVSLTSGEINIQITRDTNDTFILADCYFILQKKIPAHLNLIITVISPFEMDLNFGSAVTEYKEEVI